MKIENSCIEKCVHGLYLATPEEVKSGKANYCQMCNPALNDQRETDVVAAVQRKHQYGVADRKLSNPSKSVCPECGCDIHFVLTNGKWVCADCHHSWKGKAE
jgi:hypothetical protein